MDVDGTEMVVEWFSYTIFQATTTLIYNPYTTHIIPDIGGDIPYYGPFPKLVAPSRRKQGLTVA